MSDTLQALTATPDYQNLLERISDAYSQGRARAFQAVNVQLTTLSRDLSLRHGRGFSRANVVYMRLFYQCYPDAAKSQTLSDQLRGLSAGFVGAGLRPAPTADRRQARR